MQTVFFFVAQFVSLFNHGNRLKPLLTSENIFVNIDLFDFLEDETKLSKLFFWNVIQLVLWLKGKTPTCCT